MSRATVEIPVIRPVLSVIGDTVSETAMIDPSLRTRRDWCSSTRSPRTTAASMRLSHSRSASGKSISTGWPIISSAVYPYKRSAAGFQLVITWSSVLPITASCDDWMIDASRAAASCARLCSVTSRTAAVIRMPSSVSMADKEISAGNVLPSRRRPGQLHPRPHRPRLGIGGIPGSAIGVHLPCRVRHEDLHKLAGQLLPAVPEQALGLRVDQLDSPSTIHAYHRVRCCLEQPHEPAIREMPHGLPLPP